mgnify:FL=1
MRDTVIILIIIVAVIIGNVISQNILKEYSERLILKSEDIKVSMQNKEALKQKVEELSELWEEAEEKWSIIVTHQELDMIKTAILNVKSSIEADDFDFGYEQIENSIFLVGHIKDKWAMEWKNIF